MTAPRPRFVKTTHHPGERYRYVVRQGDYTIGQVASQPVGETGVLWVAYTLAGKPITYSDPRQDDGGPQGKVRKFLSRREAANALILHDDKRIG
jgi:hypothetical protein